MRRWLGARWDPSGSALPFQVRSPKGGGHTPYRSRRDQASGIRLIPSSPLSAHLSSVLSVLVAQTALRQLGPDRSPLFVPALTRVRLLIVAPSRTAHLRLPTRTTLRTPKVSGSLARYAAVGGCGAHGTPRPEPSLQSSRRTPPS